MAIPGRGHREHGPFGFYCRRGHTEFFSRQGFTNWRRFHFKKETGLYLEVGYTHTHTHTHTQNGTLLSHEEHEIVPFEATWIDLEIIILSEV